MTCPAIVKAVWGYIKSKKSWKSARARRETFDNRILFGGGWDVRWRVAEQSRSLVRSSGRSLRLHLDMR